MPSKKDDLHQLIHSLDPSEKGHFTRFAQRHVIGDGNNYALLFQIFASLQEYDPAKIQAEMDRLGIATPLAAAKNHLKNMVYKSIRQYNSGRDIQGTLLEGLHNLDFLYRKKQYNLLRKELRRLKKMAKMHGQHYILLKIGDYERKLHKETARKGMIEGMEQIQNEMQQVAANFQNQLMYAHLMDKMYVIATKAGPNWEAGVESILNSDLLFSEQKARTPFARIYYHQIYATAYVLQGHYVAAQREYAAVLRIWDSSPQLIHENPGGYRRILGNYLGISSFTGDYGHYEQTLDKVRNSPCTQLADEVEIFKIARREELNWRMYNHDWEGLEAMIPGLTEGLEKYGPHLGASSTLAIQYLVVTYYFLGEAYEACKKWLAKIINAGRSEQRMDIQRLAQAFNLLLTWRKGDFDFLEYEYRSAARYYESWGSGKLEEAVMDLVNCTLKDQNPASLRNFLETFRDKVRRPDTSELLGAAVLWSWAEGQLRGISSRQALAEM